MKPLIPIAVVALLVGVFAFGVPEMPVQAAATLAPGFTDTTIFTGLLQPTAVRFSRDGRVFIAEKSGLIKIFKNLTDPNPTIFADLRSNVFNYWDRGLLSIALHPNFPDTPFVYALYTLDAPIGGNPPVFNDACADPTGVGCVAAGRLSLLRAAGDVMQGPESVLIEDWCQQYPSHSVGNLGFGADGALYVSGGEGANFNYPDYGQFGNPCNDPPLQGGAIRSQDKENTAVASTSDITIFAAGSPGGGVYPTMVLEINGQPVRWFVSVQGDPYARQFIQYHYVSPTPVSIDKIKINYINDWQEGTFDKDLRVDKVVLDGVTYETEASSTYSTGTAVPGSDCVVGGYKNSEWLHCNGAFSYGNNLSPVPPPVSIGDSIGYSGSMLRIDPLTGGGLPDNPYYGGRVDDDRIIAYGMRNPFKFAIVPGTNELWVGDVGGGLWEEIDRILNPTDSIVENFGWPCYEGKDKNAEYNSANIPACNTLYSKNTATAPYYQYSHNGQTASITGLAFYVGGNYPSQYQGALFFADYSQQWIKVMLTGGAARPNPALVQNVIDSGVTAVDLQTGPNGDIFYLDFINGALHRLQYSASNTPPVARISLNKNSGPLPLTVSFDGTGSSDPDGDAFSYAWDLNGDGIFTDATSSKPKYTYTVKNKYNVGLNVTDSRGASNTAYVVVDAGNNPPIATISAPASTLTYKVGDTINFSGSATDPDSGSVPVANLSWSINLNHCAPTNPNDCHVHILQTLNGVAGGSIVVPDHEYPSNIEFVLTATSDGQSTTTARKLSPKISTLTFKTSTSGLSLMVNGVSRTTPFTQTAIVNSKITVSATTPQTLGRTTYTFLNWSDGGAQTHLIAVPNSNSSYTANYRK
jgi:glucose/arabinose dehydrogenase